jgi:dihydroorotase
LRQTSCRESVDIIRYYKRRAPGLISAETLPHNLVLDESHLATFGPYAKMSPPLRDRSHASALWDGLRDGTIDIIATDHAPHLPAEKEAGRDDIWKAGSGIPGLETFLPSLLREWNEGRVTLSEIARWTSAAPARLFGLQLRKGHLGEGADADLVMIDPSGRRTIDAAAMVTRARYTPFDGLGWNGAIKRVLLRGRTIALDGEPVGEPGGRFQAPGGKV